MKKTLTVVSFLTLLVAGVFFSGCTGKIAATVNGVIIPMDEYKAAFEQTINTIKMQNPAALQQPNAEENIGKLVLENLIVKEVYIQQAVKSKAVATQDEIDAVINNAKARFATDKDGNALTAEQQNKAFADALKSQGLTIEQYAKRINDDIIVAKYRDAVVAKNLNKVSEEDLKTFFDNISAIYNNDTKKIDELKKTPGRYTEAAEVAAQLKAPLAAKARIGTILVYADKAMSKEELTKRHDLAKSIKEEVQKSNFADVAAKYSADKVNSVYSSTINVYDGMEPVEISSEALRMGIGKTSGIIEVFRENVPTNVAQGYFIINVMEKAAKRNFTYSEFSKDIENYVNAKRAENVLVQVTNELVKNADIKRNIFKEDNKPAQQQVAEQPAPAEAK